LACSIGMACRVYTVARLCYIISDTLRLTVTAVWLTASTCILAAVCLCMSVVMCQLSTWSSTSGSSCQSSSVEIKEFFCDDELIDSSDWTLGRHVSLQADHCDDHTHANTSVIDSRAPAYTRAVVTSNSADNTLSAGMLLQLLIMSLRLHLRRV